MNNWYIVIGRVIHFRSTYSTVDLRLNGNVNLEAIRAVHVIYIPSKEHSMEEVLERPTGYPKVGGSNHGSGDFSLQPQRNPYLS